MEAPVERRLRVLFLCTQNSARSQMAEAILSNRRDTRLEAFSAGTEPAARVHPLALEELDRRGIDWSHARPKTLSDLGATEWDVVITLCERARETCPALPGQPATAHWGIRDPASEDGGVEAQRDAFAEAAQLLARRIDLLLALPFQKLEHLALEDRLRRIGTDTTMHDASATGDVP